MPVSGVYVIELQNGRYYVGKSTDVQRRVQCHLSGNESGAWCSKNGGGLRRVPTITESQSDLDAWEQKVSTLSI